MPILCTFENRAAVTFGIESANVVGYQDISINDSGFTLIAPTFEKVDGTPFYLSDLKGNFITGESVQLWDLNGATSKEYFFMAAADTGLESDGWFEDDFATPADKVDVKPGEAIAFASQGTSKIQFSGQVAAQGMERNTLNSGFTMIGNSRPSAVKLSEITFAGAGTGDSVQFLHTNGATEKEYFFMAAVDTGLESDGWFEDDFATPADSKEINAGAGVLFNAASGVSVNITIPAAL